MPSDALIQTIEKAIELVRQFGEASACRGDARRRYSPTDRLRGRETESRQHRAALDEASSGINDLREPVADALERASLDSTPWLRFVTAAAHPDDVPASEPILELLQRLQRRVRLGLLHE